MEGRGMANDLISEAQSASETTLVESGTWPGGLRVSSNSR